MLVAMGKTAVSTGSLLAMKLNQRLETLGMSRRELARRTGLSRQTIHNIEHSGATNLKAGTFMLLDKALKWQAGTAMAYALGRGTPDVVQANVEDYLVRIAIHLAQMTTEELELTLIMMEENQLGTTTRTTQEFQTKVGTLVRKVLEEFSTIQGNDAT